MRRHPRVGMVLWTASILVFVSAMMALAFFLVTFLIARFGWQMPSWVVQVISSLLGLLFTGLSVGSASTLARKRGWIRQAGMLGPILEALERISKGDFSVRLDGENIRENEPFGELIKSVNNMAVELNQMEQMRQEFISNVSHEIQSPLTSIRGFAEALQKDGITPAERAHYLDIIQSESMRLSRITENLLRLAALDSDKPKFDPKLYRLDKQIRDLILACEPQWSTKSIEMDVSLDESELLGDEDLLSQVWTNLLHNSIKFSPVGGRISISLQQEANQIRFQISDTGLGITPEDQARIFERFYKADPSRTASAGGSGLGLSIARKIVEMHQGTIGVESTPGHGSTFRVVLPMTN
jgi:two-component system, OmpR family, phosphate regulon sensor histidine kinase PhoR